MFIITSHFEEEEKHEEEDFSHVHWSHQKRIKTFENEKQLGRENYECA